MNHLIKKFKERQAVIGIVGLGYVGLPLMLRFQKVGFKVLGIDIDRAKVDRLNAGESYIAHIPAAEIGAARQNGFEATSDFSRAAEADALIICVPTPLNKNREPDLSYVTGTVDALAPHLRPDQVLSLESTTYPGTTEEELLPRIEATGRKVGHDFFLVYSPEREDPGSKHFNPRNIPKVIGGHTQSCLKVGVALYQGAIEQLVPVSSTRTAEMTKLLENIFRSVNIALVNELKILCLRMGMDIHEVIRAAATKPFGFMPFYPGPGLGGHCIPIDPFYLTSKAREYDISTRFIELAGEINTAMPYFVIQRVMEALNDHGKALKGAKVLLLGAAYKKNVDDDRESPSYKLMELLAQKGAEISYNDPHIPVLRRGRKYDFGLTSTQLTEASLAQADCILIATDHDAYDPAFILQHAQLIVDTRNIIPVSPVSVGKLYKA
ncbi:MAG: UDP-N-acetyl-D-glucosamine dehydrogenase [Deltaproteobacteria bacterium RIFOXYD12_FULL_56_24]|nr:MAG: UDP-N-acetyl-D-glucosamine dehydrogenase [Deltaproteobacteria bacterium RIFOXYD12_FULL_56_24]